MASGTGFGGVTVDAAFRIHGAAENVSAVIDLKPWFVAKSTQNRPQILDPTNPRSKTP